MKTDNLSDNEFYILQGKKTSKPLYRKVWFWLALTALAAIILAIVWWSSASPSVLEYASTDVCEESVLEDTDCVPQCAEENCISDCVPQYAEEREHMIECKRELLLPHAAPIHDTVCNNHLLRVYSVSDRKSNAGSPGGKSTWRALCEKNGEILVIESENTTFQDFAKTLSCYGVTNAIYLVDGQSYGFSRTSETHQANEPNSAFFILR